MNHPSPHERRPEAEPGPRPGGGPSLERVASPITPFTEEHMNHTAPIHEPAIRSIPLDRLYVALENVRKTPPDAVAEAELKASIANHGLLENLVVRSEGPDAPTPWSRAAAASRP